MAIYMWRERVMPDYLCFTANTANSWLKLYKQGSPDVISLETSTDWNNWVSYTFGTLITLTNIWDKVYWRNTSSTNYPFYKDGSNYYYFTMWSASSIAASWDITSLINKDFTTTIPANYCFANLFNGCEKLTSAPSLPATTLTEWCYQSMFNGCTSLTTLPSLPATTLQQYCYRYMFYYCTWIKVSTSKTWEYQTAYRIPTEWTGTTANNALADVFWYTWWTFTWTPSINTTYYTSNTVV